MHWELVWECSVLSGLQEQINKQELPKELQAHGEPVERTELENGRILCAQQPQQGE